jgi:hypothetical protein
VLSRSLPLSLPTFNTLHMYVLLNRNETAM